jgi:hypothetical protein
MCERRLMSRARIFLKRISPVDSYMEVKMKESMVICVFLFAQLLAAPVQRFEISIESGAALSGYNDIRIPNNTGTLISFSEELETDPAWFVRGRLTYNFNSKHSLSLLIAPLTLHASGRIDREVVFEGESFAPDVLLQGVFRFDSYRLSYTYTWFFRENVHFGLGITAKIRDAAISVADASKTEEKTNVGFVPLIRFAGTWQFAERLALVIDGDALAAPQGRAEDIALALTADMGRGVSLRGGYRVLEGGADVDEVYTFTWVNYFFAGVAVRF